MNKDLRESRHSALCADLKLDTKYAMGLREYEKGVHKDKRIFKINFQVQPSAGLYEGFVEVIFQRQLKILIFRYTGAKSC